MEGIQVSNEETGVPNRGNQTGQCPKCPLEKKKCPVEEIQIPDVYKSPVFDKLVTDITI